MAEDSKFNFREDKVFEASRMALDEKKFVSFRYWRSKNGGWNFIREITDVDSAFPETIEFSIPKEVMEHVVAQEAKVELSK